MKDIINDKFILFQGRIEAIEEKFEVMEGRVENVEKQLEEKMSNVAKDMSKQIEENVAKAVEKERELVKIDIVCLKKTKIIPKNYTEESKFQPLALRSSIKLSTFDGKTSWRVYETQFAIVADANGGDSKTKACHLTASLRADASNVFTDTAGKQTVRFGSSHQRLRTAVWRKKTIAGSN